MADVVTSYNGGAWTALAKMAEHGAKIDVVIKIAGEMDLSFQDCHEFDVETFRGVYGDISELEEGHG